MTEPAARCGSHYGNHTHKESSFHDQLPGAHDFLHASFKSKAAPSGTNPSRETSAHHAPHGAGPSLRGSARKPHGSGSLFFMTVTLALKPAQKSPGTRSCSDGATRWVRPA